MADVPGLPCEVFFGGIDEPLPDWRALEQEKDDDSYPEEAPLKDQARVARMLGLTSLRGEE